MLGIFAADVFDSEVIYDEVEFYVASRHGYINGSAAIIPLDGDTRIEGACPVGGDGVQFLEGAEEMLGVFAADVFDSEVIYDEGESNIAGCVLP